MSTKRKEQPEKLITIENDSIAADPVDEIYLILKNKNPADLTSQELVWLDKVEKINRTKASPEADMLLEQVYLFLGNKKKWDNKDENLYEMFEKLLFLKLKDG